MFGNIKKGGIWNIQEIAQFNSCISLEETVEGRIVRGIGDDPPAFLDIGRGRFLDIFQLENRHKL